MLDKLLLLKPAIDNLYKTTNIAIFKRSYPTNSEWEAIEVLHNILSAFYEPTIILQTQQNTTLGLVFLFISRIRMQLKEVLTDQQTFAKDVSYIIFLYIKYDIKKFIKYILII